MDPQQKYQLKQCGSIRINDKLETNYMLCLDVNEFKNTFTHKATEFSFFILYLGIGILKSAFSTFIQTYPN